MIPDLHEYKFNDPYHDADWELPAKDYGGENMPRLFALYTYDQIVGFMAKTSNIFSGPIIDKLDSLKTETNDIRQRLIDKGDFTHPDGTDCFMDYKSVVIRKFPIPGPNIFDWAESQGFNLNSNPDEFLAKIEVLVNTWWS